MDKLTFIAELAKALAWPSVVGIGLWMFGGELVKLLKEITKIKFGNLEVDRKIDRADAQLTIAEEKAEPKQPVTATVGTQDEPDVMKAEAVVVPNLKPINQLLTLADPKAAVLLAWENVEATLKFVIEKINIHPTTSTSAALALRKNGYISQNTRGAIDLLRNVRDSIASGEGTINTSSARGYVDQSERVIRLLVASLNGPKFIYRSKKAAP